MHIEKALKKLLNAYFGKKIILNKNNSKIPSYLYCLPNNRLCFVSFSQDDIDKLIQNLDPNKAHDHDNISMRMLKICCYSIYKSLEVIFKQCIETGVFPS